MQKDLILIVRMVELEENKVPKKDETEEGKNEDVNELKVWSRDTCSGLLFI